MEEKSTWAGHPPRSNRLSPLLCPQPTPTIKTNATNVLCCISESFITTKYTCVWSNLVTTAEFFVTHLMTATLVKSVTSSTVCSLLVGATFDASATNFPPWLNLWLGKNNNCYSTLLWKCSLQIINIIKRYTWLIGSWVVFPGCETDDPRSGPLYLTLKLGSHPIVGHLSNSLVLFDSGRSNV